MIKCRLCNKEFCEITWSHLRSAHNITGFAGEDKEHTNE